MAILYGEKTHFLVKLLNVAKKSAVREVGELALCFLFLMTVRTFVAETFVVPSESMLPTLQVGDTVVATKFDYGYNKYSFPFDINVIGETNRQSAHRGDVVVFRYTQDPSISFVKRVIGLPGDKVQVKAGELYLNNHKVESKQTTTYQIPYVERDEKGYAVSKANFGKGFLYNETLHDGKNTISHEIARLTREEANSRFSYGFTDPNNTSIYVVPSNYYFMMGDDRDNSGDSRFPFNEKGLGFVPQENLVGKVRFVLYSIEWTHPKFEFWYWPFEVRWTRFFHKIT